ncbi:MAG: LysR family transcriptional regulator [Ramlibacter sp.]
MKSIRGVVGLVRTVETGSFSAAAKELGISAVAVSKNVQRLEAELGVRLLQRSTRKLALTAEGRLYYDRCIGPLRELEQAQSAIRDRGRSPTGTLKVTCVPPFGHNYLVPLIPAFSALYPAIEVELHLEAALGDMIAQGYDVGIRAGEARDATMIVREVAPLHFVVCAAPGYLEKHGEPRDPADLARHNCLRLGGATSAARSSSWLLGPQGSSVGQRVSGNFVAPEIDTLVTAAIHGQGLVFAPLPMVLPHFRAGRLCPVLPACIAQPAQIFIHYPNRKQLPARVKAFVAFILEHLRRNPDLVSNPQTLVAPFLRPAA